jgi:VWFA-related protein
MPRGVALAALILIVAVSSAALAQGRFQSGVDLVALDVCVKNHDGSPVPALRPEDLLVLENNVPQKISLFSPEDPVPLAVSLLVDDSQSMFGPRLERAKAAAAALIDVLRPHDLVEVLSFNDHVDERYPLGSDHAQAKLALDGLSAKGMTAMHDAILLAVHNQERARQHREDDYREVIILLSDGENTTGQWTFDDVLQDVRHSGVLVYAVSLLTDPHDRVVAPAWELSQLAHDTGGLAVAVHDLQGLTPIYQSIAAELFHLYRVGYVPSSPAHDGQWRRVAVRAAAGDLIIRTRAGYYAPSPVPPAVP